MFRNFRLICRNVDPKCTRSVHKVCSDVSELLPGPEIESKLLKVAIIGTPNAGKSTIINALIDRKVCPTSSKVHTTRSKAMAIFTEGDSQIVFLDTPGLVNIKERKKFNLERSFSVDSKTCLQDANVVGVVHDVSNIYNRERLDIKIIDLLEEYKKKTSFLILNKVDLLKSKRKLLDITRILTNSHIGGKPFQNMKPLPQATTSDLKTWPNFQEVFMVSGLTGHGLLDVRRFLLKNAQPAKWMFPKEVWSDQTAEEIIVKSTKAKLLDFLPQEIPYTLTPQLEFFDINEMGVLAAVVLVHCPSKKIANLVAGVNDGKLRQITESLQQDLQDTFQNRVRIKLVLETPKNA